MLTSCLPLHLIRGPQSVVKIAAREREAGIRDQIRLKAQVPRHANRRFDGFVGAHPGHDESPQTGVAELLLQACANHQILGLDSIDKFQLLARPALLPAYSGATHV